MAALSWRRRAPIRLDVGGWRKAAAGREDERERYPMYMTAVKGNFVEDVEM
jgi:hypothetical protein